MEETAMIFNGINFDTYFKNYPDQNGFFGKYGGANIPGRFEKSHGGNYRSLFYHLQIQQVYRRTPQNP